MGPKTIRRRALECMQLAQKTAAPQHQALLLEMAHCWANLANAAERFALFVEGVGPRLDPPRLARAAPKARGARGSKRINRATPSSSPYAPRRRVPGFALPKRASQLQRL